MLIPDLPDDLALMVDQEMVQQRWREYKAADDRWRELKANIDAADRAVQDAERSRATLALRAARGEQVAPAEIATAAQAVIAAIAQADFVRRAEAAMESVWRAAHDGHAIAPRDAATPALTEVAARRIAAAERIDIKRQELAEAEAVWNDLAGPFEALRRLAIGTIGRQGIWRAAEVARRDIPRSAQAERAVWSPYLSAPTTAASKETET
jgi:hypothetical protein